MEGWLSRKFPRNDREVSPSPLSKAEFNWAHSRVEGAALLTFHQCRCNVLQQRGCRDLNSESVCPRALPAQTWTARHALCKFLLTSVLTAAQNAAHNNHTCRALEDMPGCLISETGSRGARAGHSESERGGGELHSLQRQLWCAHRHGELGKDAEVAEGQNAKGKASSAKHGRTTWSSQEAPRRYGCQHDRPQGPEGDSRT